MRRITIIQWIDEIIDHLEKDKLCSDVYVNLKKQKCSIGILLDKNQSNELLGETCGYASLPEEIKTACKNSLLFPDHLEALKDDALVCMQGLNDLASIFSYGVKNPNNVKAFIETLEMIKKHKNPIDYIVFQYHELADYLIKRKTDDRKILSSFKNYRSQP